MTAPFPLLIYSFVITVFILSILRVNILKILGVLLICSQMVCMFDIFMRYPSQIVWLCNIVVFMNIYLVFRYNRILFDIFFYLCWVGPFVICLMPNNPYALELQARPLFWMTYWIKHITPLLMTFYFLHVKKWKLSTWSVYTGAAAFLTYCALIYLFNLAFNENIFYLMKPASFMKSLGDHYFMIAITLGYMWQCVLYIISYLFSWTYLPKKEGIPEKNIVSQSKVMED